MVVTTATEASPPWQGRLRPVDPVRDLRDVSQLISDAFAAEMDERGRPITGDTLLLLFNAHDAAIPFTLPTPGPAARWLRVVDTAHEAGEAPVPGAFQGGALYALEGRSFALLRRITSGRRRSAPQRAFATPERGRPAGERA